MNSQKLHFKQLKISQRCSRILPNTSKYFTNFVKVHSIDLNFFQIFSSDPSHESDFGDELRPIEGDQMNYIEFSNDGLKARVNPHKESIDFWTNLEQKARQLSENDGNE